MCGRYVTPDEAALERFWTLDRRHWNPFRPSFNVAPTTVVPVVRRAKDGAYELSAARWGLIPHWWTKATLPPLTFNARSEDAATKPMWRDGYQNKRCLMPALGWYEWRQGEVVPGAGKRRPVKQPYYIYCDQSPVIAFAGLMAHWRALDGQWVTSCALLSKDAAPAIAYIHDRMPVVLPPESFAAWLSPEQSVEELDRLVTGAREDFTGHPVSARVNDARNDSPDLVQDIRETGR
jgi:putative SOS response-associated peptidase YedK